MQNNSTKIGIWSTALLLLSAGSALALWQQPAANQQNQQQQDQNDPKKKKQDKNQPNSQNSNTPPTKSGDDSHPAPLFGGTVNLKSSRQTKDSASLGFNGVDPNGQVAKSFLAANPTGEDAAKAANVAAYRLDSAELNKFIQDGNLNPNAAPQKAEK